MIGSLSVAERLSHIYTRSGDQGMTGLADGSRLRKDDTRIEALGCLDELNCQVGLLLTHDLPDHLRAVLEHSQHLLFDAGAELSLPGYRQIQATDVTALEQSLDALNQDLPPLQEFILPGGNPTAAQCHVARSVCRRAERVLVALAAHDDSLNAETLRYLNRLSDWLFVGARLLAGTHVVLWQRRDT
jgi:cob(I)alamin adenosyltransferase